MYLGRNRASLNNLVISFHIEKSFRYLQYSILGIRSYFYSDFVMTEFKRFTNFDGFSNWTPAWIKACSYNRRETSSKTFPLDLVFIFLTIA